ncbi:hypothetical protein E4U41_005699, partial [Claviceps citrina]
MPDVTTMPDVTMTTKAMLVAGLLLLAALYARHRAYPRPYKDIPHSKESAMRLLGDMPDMVQFTRSGGGDLDDFVAHRCRQLQSPIIQLFFMPFSEPLIFLDDVAEAERVVRGRTRELDRAPLTVNTFRPYFPR